jgi:hypothetical protein
MGPGKTAAMSLRWFLLDDATLSALEEAEVDIEYPANLRESEQEKEEKKEEKEEKEESNTPNPRLPRLRHPPVRHRVERRYLKAFFASPGASTSLAWIERQRGERSEL